MLSKLFTVLIIAMATTCFAQKNIEVKEAPRAMSKGTNPSFLVEIPQVKVKDIQKDWKKYIGIGSKGKLVEVGDEWQMPYAYNKNIGPLLFTVYSKMLETSESVQLTVWLYYSDSIFLSNQTTPDRELASQKYVRDFAVTQYQEAVKKELDGENGQLKRLEGELKDLVKEEDKSEKHIKQNERNIAQNKKDLSINEEEQKNKAELITQQNMVVENTRNSAGANSDAQKTLKDMLNEKKKLEKKGEKLSKDIDKWEGEIKDENRNIGASQEAQKAKKEQIEKQKQAVAAVEEKLKNIK